MYDVYILYVHIVGQRGEGERERERDRERERRAHAHTHRDIFSNNYGFRPGLASPFKLDRTFWT